MKLYSKSQPNGITIDPDKLAQVGLVEHEDYIGPCPCCGKPIIVRINDDEPLIDFDRNFLGIDRG